MFIRLKYNSPESPNYHGNDINIAVEKITTFATAGSEDADRKVTGSVIVTDAGDTLLVQESTRVIRTLIAKAKAASYVTYSNADVDLGDTADNEADTQN